ncbi:MAG: hypothetical protein IKQ31_05800 [Clostridia bacterium]|nr:hypothetical protein [Clostridia bacterium]
MDDDGIKVTFRIKSEALEIIDEKAKEDGLDRSKEIRKLVEIGLGNGPEVGNMVKSLMEKVSKLEAEKEELEAENGELKKQLATKDNQLSNALIIAATIVTKENTSESMQK